MTHSNDNALRGVCLIGFMGAGKTSVGRILANLLDWRFVDLDDAVETREHRSIRDIFRDSGELVFRRAEHSALKELLTRPDHRPIVLAVGGGAFVQPENASALREARLPVVFLDATVEELRRRCVPKGAERPLFRNQQQFRKLYHDRHESYMKANLRINTEGRTVEEVASEVAERLGLKKRV